MTNRDCKNLEKSKDFSCRIYRGACGCEDDCPNYDKEKIEMNIPEIIKEHHQAMIDKGFYDCPNCIGVKDEEPMVMAMLMNNCSLCHDSRIDPNKNIGELLMLIVSELGEALEAHRNNRFADWEAFKTFVEGDKEMGFEDCVKDTFEDEIADVFLRLFDLLGLLSIDIEMTVIELKIFKDIKVCENIGEYFYFVSKDISMIMREDSYINLNYVNLVLNKMYAFCKFHNIPIEKHIIAKMAFNKTRPHKHGKEY